LKPLTDFFQAKGDLDSSLIHYLQVMRHLFHTLQVDDRESILFPICIRTEGKTLINSQIVFPRLEEDIWHIGLPSSIVLRNHFLSTLRDALWKIHTAGVIHLDFYLSNIMWRINSNDSDKVIIKIIDWDSAHFATEPLEVIVTNRLYIGRSILASHCGSGLPFGYDVSLLNIIEDEIENEILQVRTKAELDENFKKIILLKSTSFA
jgi:serine/threonine protein kinase